MSKKRSKNDFTNIPPDIIRFIAFYLGDKDFCKYCRLNKLTNEYICSDKIFLEQLGRQRLTQHSERLNYKDILKDIYVKDINTDWEKGYEKVVIPRIKLAAKNKYILSLTHLKHSVDNGYSDIIAAYLDYYPQDYIYIRGMLEESVLIGNYEIFKFLLQHLTDRSANIKYNVLLRYSIDKDNLNIFRDLIENMEMKYPNEQLDVYLQHAVEHSKLDIVKYLINKGVKIDYFMPYILSHAAEKGNVELFKYLVKHGYKQNLEGEYILAHAAFYGKIDLVKYLLSVGAPDISKNNALIHAVKSKNILEETQIEIVKALLNNGANIHHNNDLALKTASSNDNLEVVKYLVENGANTTNVLNNALETGNLILVKYLVEHGAKTTNTLTNAVKTNNLSLIKYLVENGADIHADNEMPIILAAENVQLPIYYYLMTKGAGFKGRNIIECSDEHHNYQRYVKSMSNMLKKLEAPKK